MSAEAQGCWLIEVLELILWRIIVKINLPAMLNLKHKQHNEPSFVEHLSSIDSKLKSRKIQEPSSKSHKNLSKDPTIIPLKRKHHLPSKSKIEHIHYNSPNFEIPGNPVHTNHNFTFTHILQQHHNQPKSNMPNQSGQNLHLLHSCSDETYSNTCFDKQRYKDSAVLYSQGLAQGLVTQQQFSNMLHSKLNAISCNNQTQIQLSVEKECRKSPIRAVNPNKLNNTPKIKEKNKNRAKQVQKIQNKTFTALINSSLPTEKYLNEQINLQCSEKIDKWMKVEPEQKWQKVKFDEKHNDGRNKSNLLSTGLINLSHPSELTNQTRAKLSKQTINSKLVIEKIISEQKVKSFSDTSSQKETFGLTQKIRQIKQKAQELNKKMNQKNEVDGYAQFLSHIQSNFNPEIFEKGFLSQVTELQKVKARIIITLEDLAQKLSQLKTKLCTDIQQQINLIKKSAQTKINWLAIGLSLDVKDAITVNSIKNELLMNRISSIEEELQHDSHSRVFLQENRVRLFEEINSIDQALEQIRVKSVAKVKEFSVSNKQKKQTSIQGMRERLEAYWQKVQRLQQSLSML